jgi:hypothetical protein
VVVQLRASILKALIQGIEGSQNFDGLFLDATNQPAASISTSHVFCSIVNTTARFGTLYILDIDHALPFSIRSMTISFDSKEAS